MFFNMFDCIFCKISSGAFGTEFLYEDEDLVIFRDRNPKAATHLLAVPKKHIASIADMEDSHTHLVGKLFLACKKVADKLGLIGYNLHVNVGEEGGQEVFHIHVHLLSKFPN
jgi:histidine triad (HIT) family protein